MATKHVVGEAQQFSELVNQVNASTQTITNALRALATQHGVTLTWDPAKVLADIGAIGTAVANTTSGDDTATGALQVGRSDKSGARDALGATLFATLRSTRAAIVTQYGVAASAQVFPAGRIPREATPMVAYAQQIAVSLPQHAPGWTSINPLLSAMNFPAITQALTTQAAALKTGINAVEGGDGTETVTRVGRNVSFTALHDVRKGFLHLAIGLSEVTGQDELADHLATHHHLGHHVPAPTAAKSTTP